MIGRRRHNKKRDRQDVIATTSTFITQTESITGALMIERRTMPKGATAALTTSLFTGRVKGANDRIATGHIGIGAMGSGNLGYALKLPEVEPVAVCDVYQPTLEKAVATAGKAGKMVKAVKDFREIIVNKS